MNKYTLAFTLLSALIIAFTFQSCNQATKTENINALQTKADLLAGEYEAVCYSGFRSGQHPDRGDGAVNPGYDEILEDLNILSKDVGFRLIRLYDCDENSQMVLKVIEENKLDYKVMLGAWLNAELSNHENCWWLNEPIPEETLLANKVKNKKQLDLAISLANKYPNIVASVAVGNEALVEWNDHLMDVDTVIGYVNYVKKNIEQPVTVADNFKWWAVNGAELAKAVDFISIHVYPLWEGKDIDEAMAYSLANIQEVHDSLPDSKMAITELGWATIASEFGERASEEKQTQYYTEMMNWAKKNNVTTFFFEAFDEDWKGNPDNMQGAEKHWGMYNVDRSPKQVIHALMEAKN